MTAADPSRIVAPAHEGPGTVAAEVGTMGPEMAEDEIDTLPIWDRVGALDRMGGDEALLAELVDLLLEQIAQSVPRLSRAIEGADVLSLERVAHSLKGAAASLSAERLRHRALELEMLGRGHDLSAAPAALARLQEEGQLLRDALGR
jgi:two-component system sensor histidine kinase/response regulator